MGPTSTLDDDFESKIWASDTSRNIQKWHQDQFLPVLLSILKSRLPPAPDNPRPSLRSHRTLEEETALQARIREHMRHKMQITREILAQDAVERTFLSWRDHAVKNQVEISTHGTTAVLAKFQDQREKRYVTVRAADWIYTEQHVYLGLDMLTLESQRVSVMQAVELEESHNILSTLHHENTKFQDTLQEAESCSPEILRLLFALQNTMSKVQQTLQSSTHHLQHSVISHFSKTLHHFQNVMLPMSFAAEEWSQLNALLSFLRDAERRQRLQRLQTGVRAFRRKTKARMMIAALDTFVSAHADLDQKLEKYQQQYQAEALRSLLDFLNVQWRVQRIVCESVEQEKALPLALEGLTVGLKNMEEMDERADTQRQAREKIQVNRMLHGWRLREHRVRAGEEVERFQKEVMSESVLLDS